MERQGIYGIYLQWNIIQPSKERKFCNMYNIDGAGGYYAK
jgi:hypothetical protein